MTQSNLDMEVADLMTFRGKIGPVDLREMEDKGWINWTVGKCSQCGGRVLVYHLTEKGLKLLKRYRKRHGLIS